jgi:hypothetical protein
VEELAAPILALTEVLERLEQFRRGGALRHEGGERAFRGFLVTGFLMRTLGWPWHRLVLGESLDLLAVDWRDQPVFYIETKTPTQPLIPRHRAEIAGRLHRWGSFRFAVLTNGKQWERFDDLGLRPLKPAQTLELADPQAGPALFAPMYARNYLPDLR